MSDPLNFALTFFTLIAGTAFVWRIGLWAERVEIEVRRAADAEGGRVVGDENPTTESGDAQ